MSLWPFKCKHPAQWLGVLKEETFSPPTRDFQDVTYHLYCAKCREPVTIRYAKFVGGITDYLAGGTTKQETPR